MAKTTARVRKLEPPRPPFRRPKAPATTTPSSSEPTPPAEPLLPPEGTNAQRRTHNRADRRRRAAAKAVPPAPPPAPESPPPPPPASGVLEPGLKNTRLITQATVGRYPITDEMRKQLLTRQFLIACSPGTPHGESTKATNCCALMDKINMDRDNADREAEKEQKAEQHLHVHLGPDGQPQSGFRPPIKFIAINRPAPPPPVDRKQVAPVEEGA